MTQVDFYILEEQVRSDRYILACRIIDKAWKKGRRIYLHTNSEAESRRMDQMLWTYRDEGFLPHALVAHSYDPKVNPVLIGHDAEAGEEHDVLVNLATDVPPFFSRFERVAELVDNSPEVRKAGRNRYKLYRDRGYSLNTHNIAR